MNTKSVKLVEEILLYSFLIVVIVRFFVARNGMTELNEVLEIASVVIGAGFILVKILYKIFPKWFDNKPRLDEIEKRQFGKKN